MRNRAGTLVAFLAVAGSALSGCSGSDGDRGEPTVVVTHSILGDIVRRSLAGEVAVEVVMPLGTDPHDFEPSARQATTLREADAIVINGAGFEESLLDVITAAEDAGVPVLEASSAVELLDGDPHWFTDPDRAADVVDAVARFTAEEVRGVDAAVAEGYGRKLRSLAQELDERLAVVVDSRRKLVTNHEVLTYFADRFDFEVVGVVVPGGGTTGEPSAADLDDLAELVEAERVPAVFAEVDQPSELAERLRDEVGRDIAVVELLTESLGEPGSLGGRYVDLQRVNVDRIVAALGPQA